MSKIPTFSDFLNEDLRNWFGKGKQGGVGGGGWDRYNTKGERIGKCGDADDRGGEGEGKPKCLSTQKANQLRAQGGKQAIANAVKRKKEADPVTDRPGTGNTPKMVSNRIKEENEPTNPSLWSKAKSMARSKFDVYPSAYANGWAAKWYKDHGGGWRTKKNEQVQTSTPADREWGTDSLVAIYKHDTPGQEDEQMDLVPMRSVNEHIVKVKGGYRLVSKKTGKNLGTYPTKAGAAKRERQVQYFKHHEDTSMSLPSFKQFVAEQSHANTLREKFFDGFEGHGHDGWTEVWIDPTTGEVADASRKTLWQVARGKFPIPPDRAYRCRAWVTSKHVFVWDAEADNHMDVEAFVQRSAREQKLSMDFSHAIPLDLYYWPNAKKLGIRVSDWSEGGHVDVMTAVATLQKHPWIKGNSAFKNIIPV